MIFASEDQPLNASGSPVIRRQNPGELISNLSIEISVFRSIWLSDCPRGPGVGGLLGRYRIEFSDNDPAGTEQIERSELAPRRNSRTLNNITRRK
jgi:hypothetical protein